MPVPEVPWAEALVLFAVFGGCLCRSFSHGGIQVATYRSSRRATSRRRPFEKHWCRQVQARGGILWKSAGDESQALHNGAWLVLDFDKLECDLQSYFDKESTLPGLSLPVFTFLDLHSFRSFGLCLCCL